MAGAIEENTSTKAVIEQIESAERQASGYFDYIKKLKTRLSRTKKSLALNKAVGSQLKSLISDLRGMKAEPPRLDLGQLIELLEEQLSTIQTGLQEGFPSDLRQCCQKAGLEFKPLSEGIGVGPFLVVMNFQKEAASFEYGKALVLKDVPLNASAIVGQASSLKSALLDAPVDFQRFGSELHEAMRVAGARQGNKSLKTELRTELPGVYREMAIIRESAGTSAKPKRAANNYSLTRFVVELAQFIRSDNNVRADQQFRLEPAVIENTKNPKKSVFIPRDISCGFGEGSYYQALVLMHQ